MDPFFAATDTSGKGSEYVVFTMGRNGSLTPVYSNQPAMVPEITRRQGHEAVARVAILRENGPYGQKT